MKKPDTTPQAPDLAPVPELPPSLMAELDKWAAQVAERANAPTREALAQAGRELDELAAARAQAEALAAEHGEEIERLNAELRNARQIAMDALVGKAKDQLAIEGKDAQLADLRSQLERNVTASAAQSDARLAAEMDLVGAAVARDSLAGELKDMRAQLAASLSERTAMRAELETLRAKLAKAS